MKLAHWASVAALTGIAMSSAAQQSAPAKQPTEADASVPAVKYESAFSAYRPAAMESDATPDTLWRAANAQMMESGEHAGHAMPNAPKGSAPAATQKSAATEKPAALEKPPATQKPAAPEKPAAAQGTKKGAHDGH